MPMMSTRSCRAVLLSAALLLSSSAAMAEMQFSAYGGFQTAPHSGVDVTDGTSFTAGWEGKSFATPPYYGARATWWLTDLGRPNFGLSLDFSHAKVYADQETFTKTPGWTRLEFTDGLNIATVNGLYRFQDASRRWTPYVGAGVGINVPHVEVTRPSGTTFDYAFGGLALQAQAGVSYKITDNWSAFAEYKGNLSFVDVKIDSGDRLKTNIFTNAINVGVSFSW